MHPHWSICTLPLRLLHEKLFFHSLPEQLRGTRTRQTRKEGKENKKIWIFILVWGKRGQRGKDLERGLICQILFLSCSCGTVCQNAPCWQRYEGGEASVARTEALNTHQKLLTLISVRALQLWHGAILEVTLIDWCQTPLPFQMSPNQF